MWGYLELVRVSLDSLRLVRVSSDRLKLVRIDFMWFIIFSYVILSSSCYALILGLWFSHKNFLKKIKISKKILYKFFFDCKLLYDQ